MKPPEAARRLAERVDELVADLLPAARRSGAYWHVGNLAGDPGGSLYIHRAGDRRGHWSDAATDDFGDLLDLVNEVTFSGCDRRRALEWATAWLGESNPEPRRRPERPASRSLGDRDQAAIAAARAVWRSSRPALGTPAEAYLRHRAITIPPPVSVRYAEGVRYDGTGLQLPAALFALSDGQGQVTAVQAVFLRPDGRGKAAVATPKKTLGRMLSSAVRLAPAGRVLALGEGPETAASAMQIHGLPTWAACGSRMEAVEIPSTVERLVIFADNGPPGVRAAERAATAHQVDGRAVEVIFPPPAFKDFNDELRARAAGAAA